MTNGVLKVVGARDPQRPGSGTERSDLVRDFLNFVGTGPVRSENF